MKKVLRDPNSITPTEQFLGHLIGPLGYLFMTYFLGTYLNVYYTDICGLGSLWGGRFMSFYPVAVKAVSVVTFLLAGTLVDRTRTRWGKARPWLLVSAPLIAVSGFLLFQVPRGNDTLTALGVLGSNFLFYAVAATIYATANTLMVPLATSDPEQRSRLAVTANAQVMIAGTFSSVLMPMVLLPAMGVEQSKWILTMMILCLAAIPLILLQFAATRERVTMGEKQQKLSLKSQLKACLKSKTWVGVVVYYTLLHLGTSVINSSVFYYCNWVLGSYQDGVTQTVFQCIGSFPLGIGIFLCNPVCRKLGRKRAMCGGLLLAAVGSAVCLIFPRSLPLVLLGQVLKAIGTIPATYLMSLLLGGALDDVQEKTGTRVDGFTSSLVNAILTVSGGLAYSLLNGGMAALGYIAPAAGAIPVQNAGVQAFFIFCQMGVGVVLYPALAWLLWKQEKL